jgi:2-hydroxychromene-2-carboxylate isomerase
MSLLRTVRPYALQAFFSHALFDLKRGLHALGPDPIDLFHDLADPGSYVLLQAVAAAGLPVDVQLVRGPDGGFAPQPERLQAWRMRDAQWLALRHGWTAPQQRPDADQVRAAAALAQGADVAALIELGHALFSGAPLHADPGADDLLEAGTRALRAAGHYEGGTLRYRGEWYPGVDRLDLLLERLADEGTAVPSPLRPLPDELPNPGPATHVDAWVSFRSPYSYLAVRRTLDLPAPVRLRPVLPMVQRGLAVPRAKVLYLAWDCSRIARDLGVPYGRIADPVGAGAERCLAVAYLADRLDLGGAWLESASTGIWSEGIDPARDAGLRRLAERAGLSWSDVQGALADDDWRAWAEGNRQGLFDTGLWGVPSFRYGTLSLWGQDRLDLLRAVIERYPPAGETR